MANWNFYKVVMMMMEYPTCSNPRELAALLRVSYSAMTSKARVLGVKRIAPHPVYSSGTLREKRFIQRNYLNMSVKGMARKLDRSHSFVIGEIKRLGLVIPKEVIEKNKYLTRFKKGYVSPNKGKRLKDCLSKDAIKRISSTWFKKGHLPHNSIGKKDGDISVRTDTKTGRKYKYIRRSLAKWYPLHQHLWEKKNGKTPKGFVIRFKDGDSLNCKLSSLQLISMKENRVKNSCSVNLTDNYVAMALARKKGGLGLHDKQLLGFIKNNKELIDLKRKQLLLDRKLKNITNNKKGISNGRNKKQDGGRKEPHLRTTRKVKR